MTTIVNLKQFLKKYNANKQIVLRASEKVINNTLREMYKRMIDRTPVGNPSLWKYPAPADYTPGTLKASWRINFQGVLRTTTGQFTSADALGNTGGLSLKLEGGNQTAAIFNAQPYAQRVELGWSTQAPSGMMRITVNEFLGIFNAKAVQYKV